MTLNSKYGSSQAAGSCDPLLDEVLIIPNIAICSQLYNHLSLSIKLINAILIFERFYHLRIFLKNWHVDPLYYYEGFFSMSMSIYT